MIPAEAVEAAARAIYATEAQPMYDESKEEFTGARPWEWLTERSWEVYREKARLTLKAAAPYMLRETVTEWAAVFPTTGNAYNYHRTREEAQVFVDAMKEDGVDMIVMTREVLPAEASEWKPADAV